MYTSNHIYWCVLAGGAPEGGAVLCHCVSLVAHPRVADVVPKEGAVRVPTVFLQLEVADGGSW
jgi:hypothetical protein